MQEYLIRGAWRERLFAILLLMFLPFWLFTRAQARFVLSSRSDDHTKPMSLTEPTTLLTDYALGALCLWLGWKLYALAASQGQTVGARCARVSGDRPRILAETPEFKGEFLGLAPNSPTPLRNKNLCINSSVVSCLLSVSVLSPQSFFILSCGRPSRLLFSTTAQKHVVTKSRPHETDEPHRTYNLVD